MCQRNNASRQFYVIKNLQSFINLRLTYKTTSMNSSIEKLQTHLQLLKNLNANDKGLWGVMSPQNMVEHLGGVFYSTAMGKGEPLIYSPEKAKKVKARFMSAYYPFPKNVKRPGTHDQPTIAPPLRYNSLEEAIQKLHKAVELFIKEYQTNPEKTASHGYFGDLTLEGWLHFHIKHIEHHFRQFALLPPADEKITELEKLLYKTYTKITIDLPAKWGEMNAHQMVEHLSLVFLLSTGKFEFPHKGTEEEAKRYWEKFQQAENPWITVLPRVQFTKPRPPRCATIEESKQLLKQTFQKYLTYCENNPGAINPHFFLGNLNIDQWREVHIKHIKHHLRQFRVI